MKNNKLSFYERLCRAFSGFVRWLFRVHVEGLDNIPSDGCLLCCNHVDYPDAIILAAALRGRVRFLAKSELFRIPLLSCFLRSAGTIPVRRGTADVSAVKAVVRSVQDGECVAVYPQAHRRRGRDPRETEIKDGIGMMAYYAAKPVVPVRICLKNNRYAPFRKIKLLFGEPITYPFPEIGGSIKTYRSAAACYFSAVCGLGDTSLSALPKGAQSCP